MNDLQKKNNRCFSYAMHLTYFDKWPSEQEFPGSGRAQAGWQ